MRGLTAALVLMCGLLFAHPALAVENNSIDLSEIMIIETDDKVEIWFGHDMIATAPLGFTLVDARNHPDLIRECYHLYSEEGWISNLVYEEQYIFNASIPFDTGRMAGTILGTIPF